MEASTRDKLIQAARQCLIEKGHGACPIKEIAARAGVNHGLVHHYFGSKERLWLEVIRRESASIQPLMEVPEAGFVESFLVPEFLRRPERIRLIVEMLSMSREYPSISDEVKEIFRRRAKFIQNLLGIGDPTIALMTVSAFFGLAVQAMVDPELPVEDAAREIMAIAAKSGDRGRPNLKPRRKA